MENTLAGSDYVVLSSDVDHRGGLEQLHHLLAHLVMLGRSFDPARLYRYRELRRMDFDRCGAEERPQAFPETAAFATAGRDCRVGAGTICGACSRRPVEKGAHVRPLTTSASLRLPTRARR